MHNVLEDIYFWSGIMRDHAEFQIMNFSPDEKDFVDKSKFFKEAFIATRNEASKNLNSYESYNAFVCNTGRLLTEFINYKNLLLKRLMKCDISLNLSPTFLNLMINEANEFYRLLWLAESNQKYNPVNEIMYEHNIWLLDAMGHAVAIGAGVDRVEKEIINKSEEFQKQFRDLFIKNYELGIILKRTDFYNGALERLNEEVEVRIKEFISFLKSVEKLRKDCKVLGTIKPLLPEHMVREEEYYLYKIISLRDDISKK